jgi:hypothetical protein
MWAIRKCSDCPGEGLNQVLCAQQKVALEAIVTRLVHDAPQLGLQK